MKKITWLLLIFTFFTGIAFNGLNAQHIGDTYATALKTKSAKLIYLHPGVNGFVNEDKSGKTVGLLVEIMKEFEAHIKRVKGINVTSEFVKIPNRDFKAYLDQVSDANGGVFGLANTTITEKRKGFLQFSSSFMRNVSVLVSHKTFPELSSFENVSKVFRGKIAVGVPSTINHDRLLALKGEYHDLMEVKTVKSSHEIMDIISSDPNAYGFVNAHYYLEYLKAGNPIMRHSIGDQGGKEFGIIMPLDSDWEAVLSLFLKDFIKTSIFREMVGRNLGKDALRML